MVMHVQGVLSMADNIPRIEMAPRHMNHVDEDRDDKMRCDVALKDLSPE